ncbi:hypothetical protein [Psychrobacter pygoscelis]|uniref:hypothetical protein n=1 Tax=Psychrobacter pygoscelis TaxID=2488563 RepID=UPI00103B4354|nr:hypothetical protein [Psychrobacter pygoscelis]
MSVLGMIDIDNQINANEKKFMFPIAFERVYKNYWYKFAEENDLYWLKFFLYGIEVEKSSFDAVRKELNLFRDFLLKGEDLYYLSERKYILSRIELFLEKLDDAEQLRDDIVLYIG